jgi:membrane protein
VSPREFLHVFKDAGSSWSEDNAASMGAALAFYSLFSMAPLLLLVISILTLVVDAEVASRLIFDQLSQFLGEQGASAIRGVLQSSKESGGGIIATLVSFAMLVVGATSVLAELQRDLDHIWRYKAPPGKGIWRMVGSRLWAVGLVLAIGFLLLLSLVMSAAVSALSSLWAGYLPGAVVIARLLELGVSFVVVTGLFALIYKILPNARIAWSEVWVGAAMTSLLFTIGKWLIGLYIGRSSVASPFGAAGTLVVVILWVYYSAQVFFLGAEFTRAYSRWRNPMVRTTPGPDAKNGNTTTSGAAEPL